MLNVAFLYTEYIRVLLLLPIWLFFFNWIMASGSITSWWIDGKTMKTVTDFIILGSRVTEDGDYRHEIKRCLLLGRKSYYKPRQDIKKHRHYFVTKVRLSQSYDFSSSEVRTWELDHKEVWAPKNWCFQTMVLEKTLESPLNSKETTSVNPKGN